MIGYLSGRVIKIYTDHILFDVNGVGYEVYVSNYTRDKLALEQNANLYCHLIVREDAQILFGFFEEIEKDIFKSIIKISGVGPKLAITILSHLTPKIFIQTIREKSLANLVSIPGIGKKSAERLLIELSSSLDKLLIKIDNFIDDIGDTHSVNAQSKEEAVNALITLGYKQHEVLKVVRDLDVAQMDSQSIIKQALRLLSN